MKAKNNKNRPDKKRKVKSYRESRKETFKNKGKTPNTKVNVVKKSKSKNKKAEWDLVPIGEEFFSDKEFENLVSFEELHEYNVVDREDGTKEIQSNVENGNDEKTSNHKKRKVEEQELEPEILEEKVTTQKSKKKRKQEVNNKENQTVTPSVTDGEIINTSAGIVIVEEDVPVPALNENEVKNPSSKIPKKGNKNKEKPLLKTAKRVVKPNKKCEPQVDDEQKEDDSENENTEFESLEWTKLGIPEIIAKSLKEKKFNRPTTIQVLTLPASILGKKDVVGAAETGSGKTLAFAIPIIDGILKRRAAGNDEDGSSLASLILTPTRELAVQIKNHFDVAAKYTNIKTVVIVGGLASQKQERLLRGKPDVVIATPGRLWELIQEGDPHLSTINQVKYLAIDETDRMVERGHFQELEGILGALNRDQVYKESRQNFIFSATLAFTHEPPQRLKKIGNKKIKQQPKKLTSKDKLKQIMEMVGVRPNPKIVDITTTKGTCETLTEKQITCSQDHKDFYLYYFLMMHPGRTIVFCNSINCVRRLTNLFFLLECGEVLPLHSDMHQKQRLRNLERFTANENGILIATDVAARGLDIQNINHVIHYQVPKTAESYIHRSGRTARAFKGGLAVLMVEPAETTLVKNIFRSLERDEMLEPFDVDGKTFRELKGTVEMAGKVETFEHSVRKQLADHSWMEKAKKDMDLASSSDESDEDSGKVNHKKSLLKARKQLENYKKQLSQLLVSNSSLSVLRKSLESKQVMTN